MRGAAREPVRLGRRPVRSTTADRAGFPSITMLINDFEGGTANHVRSVAERLASSSHRVEIVSSDRRARHARTSVPVTCLSERRRLDRFPFTQAAHLVEVARRLRREPADVVHSYFYWPIMYGRFLKMLGLVSTLVENREDEGFDWSAREYAMLRATRRVPDRVVCVSRAIGDLVVRREGVPADRVRVIHNGIDLPQPPDPSAVRRARSGLGVHPDTPIVGMVANYERPVKGMDQFLEAVPLILASVPRARFVVVGRGPSHFEDRARKMGLGSKVIFAGPQDEIDAYYGLMDVSVLTSLSEGLSLVLLESMGHGLPVVATRVGGNPEVVEDEVTGFLVGADDSPAFADRVVRLLEAPQLRKKMGQAGLQRVRCHFSLETVARRYGELYSSLVEPEVRA